MPLAFLGDPAMVLQVHPRTRRPRAARGGVTPSALSRCAIVLGLWPFTVRLVDATHDCGLVRVNDATNPDHLTRFIVDRFAPIAVGTPAGAECARDLPHHTAAGLVPEVLEERLVLPAQRGSSCASRFLQKCLILSRRDTEKFLLFQTSSMLASLGIRPRVFCCVFEPALIPLRLRGRRAGFWDPRSLWWKKRAETRT